MEAGVADLHKPRRVVPVDELAAEGLALAVAGGGGARCPTRRDVGVDVPAYSLVYIDRESGKVSIREGYYASQ